jgi:hypothetical protein
MALDVTQNEQLDGLLNVLSYPLEKSDILEQASGLPSQIFAALEQGLSEKDYRSAEEIKKSLQFVAQPQPSKPHHH